MVKPSRSAARIIPPEKEAVIERILTIIGVPRHHWNGAKGTYRRLSMADLEGRLARFEAQALVSPVRPIIIPSATPATKGPD